MTDIIEVMETENIPNPIARKLLEEYLEEMGEDVPEVSLSLLNKVKSYLEFFSKCNSNKANEALRELNEKGFSTFAASMLINLLPSTVEEAKALLADIDGGYSDSILEEALAILSKYCSGE